TAPRSRSQSQSRLEVDTGGVIAGADDQVAATGLGAVGDADGGSVADDAEGDKVGADAAVQLAPQRVVGGHEERIGASGGQGGVGGRGSVHRLLRVAAVDAVGWSYSASTVVSPSRSRKLACCSHWLRNRTGSASRA